MASDLPDSDTVDIGVYEDFYKHLHANPELSTQEEKTGALVASRLRDLGIEHVHERVGGHGVAAVISNGSGPRVLLRADFDALPVREQTGLPYASTATMRDVEGVVQPVMHACGHDMHTAALLGAAEAFTKKRSAWSGTLILVFQPAEEKGSGAKAMVDDGLYEKVPEPDVVLGQHVGPFAAGLVGVKAGTAMAAAEASKITFFGRGGHGSQPHTTIDPVVMAASAVLRLQTIVSREVNTGADMAVVTVGSLQAGQTENIIPSDAVMKTTIRTFDDGLRDRVLASVRRIVKAEADASGAVKAPTVETISRFPLTYNDPEHAGRVADAFRDRFADSYVADLPRWSASEDVSVLATSVGKPCVFWFWGGQDPDAYAKAKEEGKVDELPGNHSPFFAPVIQPTLSVGIQTLCTAALVYLANKTS